MELRLANEEDKRGGWTLSTDLLNKINNLIDSYEDSPSLEGIELVLLAFHGLPLPKVIEYEYK